MRTSRTRWSGRFLFGSGDLLLRGVDLRYPVLAGDWCQGNRVPAGTIHAILRKLCYIGSGLDWGKKEYHVCVSSVRP